MSVGVTGMRSSTEFFGRCALSSCSGFGILVSRLSGCGLSAVTEEEILASLEEDIWAVLDEPHFAA